MYESDDIIKYLVGKYGACDHINLAMISLFHYVYCIAFIGRICVDK